MPATARKKTVRKPRIAAKRPRPMAGDDRLKLNNVSSATVAARTGKSWEEWLKVLDAAGARKLDHKAIVKIVAERFDVGPWWQQMVTVGYEQARGLRDKNQTKSGYRVSVTRTLPVPMDALFAAWTDQKRRRRWLRDELTIRRSIANRSMRITWRDGTNVEVMFYPQSSGTSRVNVEHNKLPTKAVAERMRSYWKQRMDEMTRALDA